MACSKYEYIKSFETDDALLKNCWIVCRIDGRGFNKFSQLHHFTKPNDDRALFVMSAAAADIMREVSDISLAYGQSDEYSFLLDRSCDLYSRRSSKILSTLVSMFTGFYIQRWMTTDLPALKQMPVFDGRLVLYPSESNVKDYFAWRQADCHINNMYNYCFWKLRNEGNKTPNEAYDILKVTNSADKNEMLFSQFSINYNNLPQLHRKGTIIHRIARKQSVPASIAAFDQPSFSADPPCLMKSLILHHDDIIQKSFWEQNPHILNVHCP